ncbi:MAG: outer membrane beta-barrel domain-containing protein [Steroidobacteraceae bacterium]|nr:outer membrane beta-barrel domain-containing protein [Deltaproteobacteria bacterium]
MKKIFSMAPVIKKLAPVLLASVFLLPLSARAEIKAGSVEVTPFGGYNFFEKRQNLEDQPLVGARLGYNFTNSFGIEGTWEFMKSYVDDKNTRFSREGQFTRPISDVSITQFSLDLVYHFMPESVFNPFIVGGYGIAHYSPKINNKNMSVVNFGLGAKYWVAEHVALRADIRDNLVLDETIHNVETTLGVVFAFGGESKKAAAPLDSDNDGVLDTLDKCPGTPSGVVVDKDGCPLDTDKDGVADYLDKCPDTPAGVAVDKDGCPPVVDKVVILASEPKVEEKILVAVAEPKVIVLAFEDVHFDFDKSTLKPEAKTILKRNIQLLKENPKAHIRIAGYTSASGSEEYNQKLSVRRAKAVQEFLVSEGVITPDRLSIIGYGERNPAVHEVAPKDLYSDAAKANIRVLFEIVVQ